MNSTLFDSLRTHTKGLGGRALVLVLATSFSLGMPGCALFNRLTGGGGSLGQFASSGALGQMAAQGGISTSALASANTTVAAMRSGNVGALTSVSVSLGVPAALSLGKLAVHAIQDAVKRRQEERQRKLQATQLFYNNQCALEPGQKAAAPSGPADDPAVLEAQAEQAFSAGDYAAAEAALVKAQQKREPQSKDKDGAVALSRVQNRLAALYFARSEYDKALPLAQRAVELREKTLGKDDPAVAESLAVLGSVHQAKSEYPKAETELQRALKVREAALKDDHICVAQSANQLANLYQELSAYQKAEDLYTRALLIRQSKLGEDSLEVAESNSDLGGLQQAMGNYAAAEPYYQRALKVRRAKLGADHPEVAETLNELGTLSRLRGAYPQAESRYQQALAIREKKLPPSDPRIADTVSDLATLYQTMGDYKAAEPLLRRALDLRTKALGKNHPDVAESLDQLALLLQAQGNVTEAESLLKQAQKIREDKFGANNPAVATSLSDLGDLYARKGDTAQAEQRYQKALEIRTKGLGAEHPLVARTQFQLGMLLRARGDLARAEPLLKSSLALREKLLGGEHPEVAESLVGLAATQIGLGRTSEALPELDRAVQIDEAVLRSIGGSANESRVDAFLRTLRAQEEVIYSLLIDKAPSEAVVSLAATTALLRKGRSVDEAADTSRALYQGLGPEEKQKLAALREVRTQRADLALSGAGVYPPDVYQKLLKDLQASEEKQQQELLQSSAALREKIQTKTPAQITEAVQKALPEGGALVELVAFREFTFKPTAQKPATGSGPVHYVAMVVRPTGKPRAFDLGPSGPIDGAVSELLAGLTDAKAEWEPAAKKLDQLVLEPLRGPDSNLKGTSRLYLSPDGQLSLVPFAVLPLGQDKGLIADSIDLTYLTSGRDLLRTGTGTEMKTTVAMLADPQFAMELKGAASEDASTRSTATGIFRGLRLGKVNPLPGTREEAKAIGKLLKKNEVQTLLGPEATKREFLRIEQPGILHAATHGLFLGETSKGGDTSRGVSIDDGGASPAASESRPASQGATAAAGARPVFLENPLLSSMLVMAGAETATKVSAENRDPEVGNGLVTALEMASMNLWGTQLVVLSACETGRGDVSNLGQGVYGLRRAVMVAGAQTLLTSLWKVDDKATMELMKRFYKGMLKGQGRAEAMREAAKAIRKSRPHPFFWAPFITIGRSGPLEGIGKPAKKGATEAKDDDNSSDE